MMTTPTRPRREKFEQADGIRLLRTLGAAIYESGTRRPAGDYQGTRQTPGIPDVEVFLPARIVRRQVDGVMRDLALEPRLLKWECKSATGRLSPAQQAYRACCLAAHVAHVAGDLTALIAWLVAEGYVRAEQLPHDRQPAAPKAVRG